MSDYNPVAVHYDEMPRWEFITEDVPSFTRQITEGVELVMSIETGRIIGIVIHDELTPITEGEK